eukprot:7376686-Prymnesium_polylepis.1
MATPICISREAVVLTFAAWSSAGATLKPTLSLARTTEGFDLLAPPHHSPCPTAHLRFNVCRSGSTYNVISSPNISLGLQTRASHFQ